MGCFSLSSHVQNNVNSDPIEKIEVSSNAQNSPLDSKLLPANITTIDSDEIMSTNVGSEVSNIFRRVPGNGLECEDLPRKVRMGLIPPYMLMENRFRLKRI